MAPALRPTRRSRKLCLLLAVCTAILGIALGAPGVARAANVTTNIRVVDSNGNGIAGVPLIYAVDAYSGFNPLGTTDANGTVSTSVPEGSYLIEADYNQGSARTPGPVDISQPFTFHTVKVTLLNPGLLYGTDAYSGWHAYTGPMQMFPGEYSLDTGRTHVRFTVGTSDFTGGVATLLDHSGNGLAGGTASYYLGGWYNLPGATDATGSLVFSIPNDSPYLSLAMSYHGTSNQQSRTQLAASNFTFQTALANVKLVDADENPLDTGSASYYAGGWQPASNTAGGTASFEMLPGSYSFAMGYNHTSQQKDHVAISSPTTDVVFQTGRLTAYFSQPFSWFNSQFYPFSPATQEFLPGQIGLQLPVNGCQTPKFPIAAGDHLVKTGIVATLVNSSNQPLAGGTASAYAGGWHAFTNPTDAAGRTCEALDGHLGNTAVAMTYNGTRQQISQNAQTNGIYPFKTTDVTVKLVDSSGNPLDTGGASYYAGSWRTIGDTSNGVVHVQMLPGSYSFAMTYNGTRQQLNGQAISGTSDTVVFQTADVTVELRDSNGALLDTGGASYYAGGWRTIGDTSNGVVHVQMLPGSYSFAMTYLGTRQQLNGQTIAGTSGTVTFQTGSVHSDSGTATSYYAGSWRPFTNDMELLPGTYAFHFSSPPSQSNVTITGGGVNTIT